ncbi:MAG: hypothetical protein PWP45_1349, partial [Tepidanaerobacteraceae bacterium]|nr:hypothetical protein [Tepidanaerobacteraceae bacterium]
PGRAEARGAGRDNWRGPGPKGDGAEAVYAHRGGADPLPEAQGRDVIMAKAVRR